MSRIFEVVQSLSGQRNSITIPRPYLTFFSGDQQCHALAAVLNQLVFWSGYSTQDDGWFYKSHEELGEEVGGLSSNQVFRLIEKITKKYLPGVVQIDIRKVNGTPTKHYRIDGDALIAKIFPPELDSAKSQNGNREDAKSDETGNCEVAKWESRSREMENAKSRNLGNCEVAKSFLYTDLDTDRDLQIYCQADELPDELTDDNIDPVLRVLNHFNRVTNSEFRDGATTRGFISGVLQGEYVADDLMLVVDYIANEWAGQDNMSFYLRPKTIFSQENFEGYFDQARAWRRNGKPQKIAEPAKVNIDLQNQDYSGKPKGFRT